MAIGWGWRCHGRTAASKPVDVLRALGVQDGRDGVSIAAGICTQRRGAEESDFAFRLENSTQLSAPTRQLFRDGHFPEDFSILATLRAQRGSQAFLLSLYDERGVQQLGVEIGRSPVFLYEDQAGQPAPERYPLFSRVSLADGKWHRVALSVEGTNVSLLVDCQAPLTLPLERGPRPVVSTAGITLLGTRLLDEEVFQVGLRRGCVNARAWGVQLLACAGPSSARAPCQPRHARRSETPARSPRPGLARSQPDPRSCSRGAGPGPGPGRPASWAGGEGLGDCPHHGLTPQCLSPCQPISSPPQPPRAMSSSC
uniref:Thrombospondin-like N-terminal domain-containing protein n=1 Tax=Gopherus agassizii TaxID=38772 RepID=A0A452GWD1_9SAUR